MWKGERVGKKEDETIRGNVTTKKKKKHKQAVVKNTQAIILQTNAHVRHYPLDNFNLALKLTLADSILVTTMLSEKLKGKAIS